MKKYKLFLVALLISLIWICIGAVRLSGDKTPDAGLEIFNYILGGVILSVLALAVDLYFAFGRSVKNSKVPSIRKRKTFWQIIGGLVAIGIVYVVYVLAVT